MITYISFSILSPSSWIGRPEGRKEEVRKVVGEGWAVLLEERKFVGEGWELVLEVRKEVGEGWEVVLEVRKEVGEAREAPGCRTGPPGFWGGDIWLFNLSTVSPLSICYFFPFVFKESQPGKFFFYI